MGDSQGLYDGYEDLPESFLTATGPSILMAVWNTFIVPDEETKEAIKHEEYDEQTGQSRRSGCNPSD